MEADSFSLKLPLSVLTKEDKASWLCSTYFEYSTYGVNGSEPLTTIDNLCQPSPRYNAFCLSASNLSFIATTRKPLSTTFTI